MPDNLDTRLLAAMRRAGSATTQEVFDELRDRTLADVAAGLQRLAATSKIEDCGGYYRHVVPSVDLSASATPFISHNDPDDIYHHIQTACQPHADILRYSLEGSFRTLIANAKTELHIVSPYLDQEAIQRFIPEFDSAFKNGSRMTLVVRGVAAAEDQGRPGARNSRIRGIIDLYTAFKRYNAEPSNRFLVSDYTAYHHETIDLDAPAEFGGPRRSGPGGRLRAAVHQKIIVQDRTWAYVGSGEFRRNSFGSTGEIGVVLQGTAAAAIASMVDCYQQHGASLDPGTLESLLSNDRAR